MAAGVEQEMVGDSFWRSLEALAQTADLVIDRPRGSPHPRFPSIVCPLDYGYLQGTSSGDGRKIDVWRGSLPEARLAAVVCTVDFLKKDVEVKLLLGCTDDETDLVHDFHNAREHMAAILIRRSA